MPQNDNKNNKIYIVSTVVLVGFFLSVLFHYVYGLYLNTSYPLNTFLFIPTDRFNDFFNPYYYSNTFNASAAAPIPYLPFAILLMRLFALLPPVPALVVMIFLFLGFFLFQNNRLIVNDIFNRYLKPQVFFIFSFLTYPMLFAIDRGNIELIVYIFIGMFLYGYYIKKSNWLSIIFLSMAIAMKIFPAVFLVLFVSDKKYREAIYCLLSTVFITFTSLGLMSYLTKKSFLTIFNITRVSMSNYTKVYTIAMRGLNHGHTLWGIINVGSAIRGFSLTALLKPYEIFALIAFLIIALFIIFFEKENWRKVALLVLAMILLPHNSNDYTLLYVFFPLILFINSTDTKRSSLYAFLFGLLLIPLDYYYFKLPSLPNDISISVLLYPIIMSLIIMLIIWDGLKKKLMDNLTT